MFICTICGLNKTELGSKPEFEFRRRRHPTEASHLEGMSDWCTKCEALRFFFKSDVDKDPSQQLEGQELERKVANHALEASIKCWTSRERPSKEHKDVGTQHRTVRHDPQKVMMQEIRDGLPSQLPHGSMWERKLRSVSEDRSRHREKGNPAIERRSRSAVNESPREKAKVAKQQAENRSHQTKDIAKLESLKPNKHIKLDFPTPNDAKEQRNYLEEQADDEDTDDSYPSFSPRGRIKLPFDKRQLEELVSPLRKDVQQRVKQLVNESPKKKKKAKHAKEDPQSEKASKKQRHSGGVSINIKTLAKDEMSKLLQQLQDEEKKQQLKTKLKEKKHQMCEWKRIRRRVEDECARVKTELDELKIQAELKAEQQKRDKDKKKKERMSGGAHILALKPNDEEQAKDSKEKTIGDALDEKIEHMLEALQEGNQPKEATAEKKEEIPEPAVSAVSELSEDVDNVPSESCEIPKISSSRPKRVLSKLNILLSTVQRARFRGFAEDPQELLKRLDGSMPKNEPPLPHGML
ncbi:hypothetical protein ACLKA6_011071 [Drosophila palustris]